MHKFFHYESVYGTEHKLNIELHKMKCESLKMSAAVSYR